MQNDKDEVLTSLITEAKPSFISPSQFYGNENGGFDCSFEDLDMRMELVESCIFLKESSRNKKETSLNFEKSSVQPECKRIKNSATESSVRNIYSLNTDSKFPYIEIRISDVLNDDGNQITRRIKIADSSKFILSLVFCLIYIINYFKLLCTVSSLCNFKNKF